MLSEIEEKMVIQFKAFKMNDYVREYRFDEIRRWRFDFAFLKSMLAVEIEGGIWVNGRHTRGSGFAKDIEKYNAATTLGWRVLRFTAKEINSGDAMKMILHIRRGE